MSTSLTRLRPGALLLIALAAVSAATPGRSLAAAAGPGKADAELLFNSGFEKDTAIVARGTRGDRFTGVDHSVSGNRDWGAMARDTQGRLHGGGVTYNAGTRECREAALAPDPAGAANRVVRFRGVPSARSAKFRIQADFHSPVSHGLKEFTCSVRLYVPKRMAVLRDYPKAINWLTVAEFWNDPAWTSREETEHAFRVTVGIGKHAGAGQDLYFRISTDDFSHTGTGKSRKYRQIHLEIVRATDFAIPFGKWMTLEYYFRDGGRPPEDGRGDPGGCFYMAATPEGGERRTVCSLHATMHSPANPAPKGVTLWAPMKMYTSKSLARWMQTQKTELELFYDDLAIWKGRALEVDEPNEAPRPRSRRHGP